MATGSNKPTSGVAPEAEVKLAKPKRKKVKRSLPIGRIYVRASFNNTLISVTDPSGNVVAATSSGACGFRGSKKGVAYAAQVAANQLATTAQQQFGLKQIDIFVKGIGQGRDAALRTIVGKNFKVASITDGTKIAHGGVRARRTRRV